MLNDTDYRKSLTMLEQIKYNIHYDRRVLMNIVIRSLARTLLDCSWSAELTDEQLEILNNLIEE